MNLKPQDVFIGIIDFFVIMLPGAFLVFLILWYLYDYPFDSLELEWSTLEAVAAFVFASYLLGHVVSQLGSTLEDLVSRWRKPWVKNDELRHQAEQIRAEYHLPAVKPSDLRRRVSNLVRSTSERDAAYLDRQDADRRFVRNSMIVAFVMTGACLLHARPKPILWWLGLGLVLAYRLREENRKYTRDVYELFIGQMEAREMGKRTTGTPPTS